VVRFTELECFYKTRKEFIDFENVDYTDVFDPYLDIKIDNPIMIIGEAPGANEVAQNQPFIGMAGKNLSYLIALSKLDRQKDFLITNAFPFRTFEGNKNRTPKASELKKGAKLLLQEIEIVKPKMILLLGNSAIRGFSYLNTPNIKDIKKFQKNSFNTFKFNNFETIIGISHHPSPIAFNRKNIREDLENFFGEIVKELKKQE
jgi:DNA polymerase